MLIAAGDNSRVNAMTASWGGLGVLWHKQVATVYVRESRFTLELIDKNEGFSLSFLGAGFRDELNLIGSKSGRDGDKIKEAGLHVSFFGKVPAFNEAETVLCCRKLFRQRLELENFLDAEPVRKFYPTCDRHVMFIAEIEAVYEAQRQD